MLTGLTLFLVVLTMSIGIHEYGHYRAMLRNGVRVTSFQIGFGPTLKAWTLKNGTIFSIKLILLGGAAIPAIEGPGSINEASRKARFQIYIAGMVMNCVLAMAALLVLWYGFHFFPQLPDGALAYITWAPKWLRIPVAAIVGSFGMWFATPVLMVDFFAKLGGSAVMGPVGIAHMATQVANGATSMADLAIRALWFLWVINVALAQWNLLPIPGLDGGHLAMLPFDRWMSQRTRVAIVIAGLLFLGGVIIYATYGDIVRLLGT